MLKSVLLIKPCIVKPSGKSKENARKCSGNQTLYSETLGKSAERRFIKPYIVKPSGKVQLFHKRMLESVLVIEDEGKSNLDKCNTITLVKRS